MLELRPYQAVALEALRGFIRNGKRRIVTVAPTGAGKTVLAAALIDGSVAKGKKCLFLAHRKELINQCSDKLDMLGIEHGVIQGNHHRLDPGAAVQVASVQTLGNREKFPADLIIIDECHRSTSETYKKIISWYERPVIIGLTATPYRMDGTGLIEAYDDLYQVSSTQSLIDSGFLVKPIVYGSKSLDLSEVKLSGRDFDKKSVADAMNETVIRGDIVENWKSRVSNSLNENAYDKNDICTVVFAANIEQSILIAKQFNDSGIPARHLDGNTPDKERDLILLGLRKREIKVVCNYSILGEGWDLPHLECVILARPTRSRSLYRQMVGRVMRTHPDKKMAVVMDHANCTFMHGFVTDEDEYTLNGREKLPKKTGISADVRQCKKCGAMLAESDETCSVCGDISFKKNVRYTNEDLVEINEENVNNYKKAIIKNAPLKQKQERIESICEQCIKGNYKPNWARVKFMGIFGEWPTWQSGIRMPREFIEYEKKYKIQPAEPPTSV